MPGENDRERSAPPVHDGEAAHDTPASDRNGERLNAGGGLRYQQAHRAAGPTHDDGPTATAGARSEIARETDRPAQDQRADHHGGPGPDDEAWLGDQGYPKLGKTIQSRVTQVEHGPYAGGTQQGDAATRKKARREQ